MPNEAYAEALRQAGNLNNRALDVPPYEVIKHLMTNSVMGPGGQVNIDAIKNSAAVALGLLGTGAASGAMPANSVGAFKPSLTGKSIPRNTYWSDGTKLDRLRAIDQRLEGKSVKDKLTEFRSQNPDFEGSDNYLKTMLFKAREGGGGDTTLGSNFGNRPPGGPPTPRLGENNLGETMSWLLRQQPVTPKWAETWAKEAGVPFNTTVNKGTSYVHMNPDNPISKKPTVVRIPEDMHWGRPTSRGEVGNRFDTGIDPGKHLVEGEVGFHPNKPTHQYEAGLINEAGMSYAHPEAMEKALELSTGASRTPFGPGGFKLVSPDYAPRYYERGAAFHDPKVAQDPNQLKLLSGGPMPTTADIIKILQRQGMPSGQET